MASIYDWQGPFPKYPEVLWNLATTTGVLPIINEYHDRTVCPICVTMMERWVNKRKAEGMGDDILGFIVAKGEGVGDLEGGFHTTRTQAEDALRRLVQDEMDYNDGEWNKDDSEVRLWRVTSSGEIYCTSWEAKVSRVEASIGTF